MPHELAWLLVPTLAVWTLALLCRPVRHAYLNGWRCVIRHPLIWKLPAGLTMAYGLFQAADFLLLTWRSESMPSLGTWNTPGDFREIIFTSLFPATEALAAVFNCLTATFPLSSLVAVLVLLNLRGLAGELGRTLARLFGLKGRLLFVAIMLCAACAAVKPLLLLILPEIIAQWPFAETLISATAINALAFVFEYLLGTCFQIYLILVAVGWVRGAEFSPQKLMRFAVRRLGFVFKWALVIIVATILLVQLPMFAGFVFTGVPAPAGTEFSARLILALAMLAFASVQIRLVLHSETLGRAFYSHLVFFRQRGFSFLLFLIAGYTLLLPWMVLSSLSCAGFGETFLGLAGSVLAQMAAAIFSGWILASWVCFYKSSRSRELEIAY